MAVVFYLQPGHFDPVATRIKPNETKISKAEVFKALIPIDSDLGASKPDSTSIRWRIFNCRRLKGLGTQPVETSEYIYALSIIEQFSTEQNVGQFVTCLIEAKDELQHKSEVVKRKFTITKALLCKADRSSFDRLCQQIYKLELEQKRLEEDAFVYNWFQQQIKRSPAYKMMLELGACMDMKANSGELVESTDADLSDISFEELLAQEKEDVFWQRNGRLKPCSG
ncbi:uncharacterized protein LOC111406857 [Olea europaea var. sylvestris]|uniref:uncharacterized protein LOC111406857 n=1 Tax=Olea europaea var. sylvestris TaxID=158386 RepID=UPI000C1D0165|nr:uncharacterized protein LOC111406857 [Olea europaea var. sylvestris]